MVYVPVVPGADNDTDQWISFWYKEITPADEVDSRYTKRDATFSNYGHIFYESEQSDDDEWHHVAFTIAISTFRLVNLP